jgi:peptidoglycan hydrolase CwlO-like protein
MELNTVLFGILASLVSGAGTAVISSIKESKREKIRKSEKEQDMLKMELKDLQIKLYKIERDLDEWKDKYYEAIQELIVVRAELEETLIKLTHAQIHNDED